MFEFRKMVVKQLREVADKIDAGTSEITEREAMDILGVLVHEAMSKEDACGFMNLSRSRFDELVRLDKLPKGRKRRGFKELVWYKDELKLYADRCKKDSRWGGVILFLRGKLQGVYNKIKSFTL